MNHRSDGFLPSCDFGGGDEEGLHDAVRFPHRRHAEVNQDRVGVVVELVPGLDVDGADEDLRQVRVRVLGVLEEDVPPEDPVV